MMTEFLITIVALVAFFCLGVVLGAAWIHWRTGREPITLPREDKFKPPPPGFTIDRTPQSWWKIPVPPDARIGDKLPLPPRWRTDPVDARADRLLQKMGRDKADLSPYAPKPKREASPNRQALLAIWSAAKLEQARKPPVEYQVVPPPAERKASRLLPSVGWGKQ